MAAASRWAAIVRPWCAHLRRCTRLKLETDAQSVGDADACLLRLSILYMTADALLTCREALELLAVVARVDVRAWLELLEFHCGCDGLGKALSALSLDASARSLPRIRVEFVSHRPYGERVLDTTGHRHLFLPTAASSAEFRAALQQLYACMTSAMRSAFAASHGAAWRTTLRFVLQDYVYADTTAYLESVRAVVRAIATHAALFRSRSATAASSPTAAAAAAPMPPLDPIASAFLFELERGEVSIANAFVDASAMPVVRDLAALGVQFVPDESVCDSNARIPLACLGPIVLELTDAEARGFSQDLSSPMARVFPVQTHALTIRSRFAAPQGRAPRLQALVSALASARSVHSVVLDSLGANRSVDARAHHWRWLSYMLWSKQSRSSVQALTLKDRTFSARDVQAIMSVLRAKFPAHMLMDRESLVDFFDSSRTSTSDLARTLGLATNSSARLYELLNHYSARGSLYGTTAASLLGFEDPLFPSTSSSSSRITGVGAEFAALFAPNSAARQFHQRLPAPVRGGGGGGGRASARGGRGGERTTAAARRNPQPQPVRSSYLLPPSLPFDARTNAYYPLNIAGGLGALPTSRALGIPPLVYPPLPPLPSMLPTAQRGGRGGAGRTGGRTGGQVGGRAGGRGGRGATVSTPAPAAPVAPRAPMCIAPPLVTDTDLGSVLLQKGAVVFVNPFDVETETPEPIVIHQAALFPIIRDDSRCQWIDIVVPGYGYCAVPRALVNHVELTLDDDDDDDDAVKSSVTRGYCGALTSLTLSFGAIDPTPNVLLPLLQYLGPRLETLVLDFDLPANPEELGRILDACPRLRKLTIRVSTTSRVLTMLAQAYATGRCRVEDLEIARCPSDVNTIAFVQTLGDASSVAARTLKRLALVCSRTLSADVVAAVAQALQANTTLASIKLSVGSALTRTTWLSLIRTDGKHLPGTKAPLPLASRLAFLSVVRRLSASSRGDLEPLRKRHRLNSNSTSDSALGRRWAADLDRLDTGVVALIFAFGAEPNVRHVGLQSDDVFLHTDAYFDDEDGEDGDDHSGEDDYLSDMSGETNEW